ncbi:pyridoxal phosphate-dependent aminotransferase [Pectinatus cerevisiiphilus]|uniref:Aromatic-amino-acid transaminase n=1 Tax=Pectinatus cerevisiiphilus TaxID=86956 RepID=A0A4R3KAN8_9FIRM|nr:aminotransferase class I/II-fold pyridoxal phosphate-dependent enzyme [Pectinatus cerevisiiphilus]TCS80050.1 aromatic-amino-acid transaminase [Pectinatus cerevisiiphilus]
MTSSMAASHSVGKVAKDVIFGASAACREAVSKYGSEKVTNATIGAIMDDNGHLACIPIVEKVLRTLPINDLISYAPISGVPEYLDMTTALTFGDHRPDGYTAAVATAGGTGGIHHTIWNYTEMGDSVLTSNWFWGTYNMLCHEAGRKLVTYPLFDEKLHFNINAFSAKVDELIAKQDSLLIIINAPAHNPTGYSLSESEWSDVLAVCRKHAKIPGKKITIMVDIAYIDFAGEKNETRKFMQQFSNLPDNILTIFTFSMSKGYTVYGQRCGSMIGLSSSKEVITEFANINKYTSRATWSNVNHGAMALLVAINKDKTLQKQFEIERDALYQMIRRRGAIFMEEAQECGLKALPYKAGFFLSIPAKNATAVCDKMHDDLIFAVPLKAGVRIAVCSVPINKMHGIAKKVLNTLNTIE